MQPYRGGPPIGPNPKLALGRDLDGRLRVAGGLTLLVGTVAAATEWLHTLEGLLLFPAAIGLRLLLASDPATLEIVRDRRELCVVRRTLLSRDRNCVPFAEVVGASIAPTDFASRAPEHELRIDLQNGLALPLLRDANAALLEPAHARVVAFLRDQDVMAEGRSQ